MIERPRDERRNAVIQRRSHGQHFLRELARAVGTVGTHEISLGDRPILRRIDRGAAGDQHARLEAGFANPVEQVMRAKDVARKRFVNVCPGAADVRHARQVINLIGLE